jgi:transcriptional regulator
MYIPKRYEIHESHEIEAIIRNNGFATVISCHEGVPVATHLPLELASEDRPYKLLGHFARANQHWKAIRAETEVLAIFHGPHTYISPRWYDHINVPTWNYLSVHCYGKMRFIEGPELRSALDRLVRHYEGDSPTGYSVEKLPAEFYSSEVKGIVGFEITVSRIEAAGKLSQNRNAKNFVAVMSELRKRADENSLAVAEAMETRKPTK